MEVTKKAPEVVNLSVLEFSTVPFPLHCLALFSLVGTLVVISLENISQDFENFQTNCKFVGVLILLKVLGKYLGFSRSNFVIFSY